MDSSLNQWLRNAHAMEVRTTAVLTQQSRRMQAHPELKARFDLHLHETREQRQRLEAHFAQRPRSLGESGKAEDTDEPMDNDEVLKFVTDFYVSKYQEIATYRVLLTAAEALEDSEVAQLCEEMLWVEDAMAAWLRVKLPELVRDCLVHDDSPSAGRSENTRHLHH
jgi:ferritin-like metal-binding protein YciE